MRQSIIHDLPGWQVTSYGNGLAYAIEHGERSLYFQGDDAAQFRDEFDNLTSGIPSLDYAAALQVIWNDYESVSRETDGLGQWED